MNTKHRFVVLEEDDQGRLREQLTERGELEVAEALGVSRVAILRGAAGLGVLRGTKALIADGLDALDEEDDESEEDEDIDEDEDEDGEGDDVEDEDAEP